MVNRGCGRASTKPHPQNKRKNIMRGRPLTNDERTERFLKKAEKKIDNELLSVIKGLSKPQTKPKKNETNTFRR